jgi:hypothetical protein
MLTSRLIAPQPEPCGSRLATYSGVSKLCSVRETHSPLQNFPTLCLQKAQSPYYYYYYYYVLSKLEYASVALNPVTITDSNKLERMQRKFVTLCHNQIFKDIQYRYDNLLEN